MPSVPEPKKTPPKKEPSKAKKGAWVFTKNVKHGTTEGRKLYKKGQECPSGFLKHAKEHGLVEEV
jgi:hypothetical protein